MDTMINRQEVLQKLNEFLDGRITKEEIYEWAFKIVMSKEYNKLYKKDKLLSDTIHALFCVHDQNPEYNTSKEELLYLKNRLQSDKQHNKTNRGQTSTLESN